MQETHLELGHPGVWRKERRAQSFVPIPWFRRRKWAIGSILLFGVVFVWLYVAGHAPRGLPWGGAPPGVDAEVVELVRTVPGAQPGVSATKHDPLADAGHDGRPYPTREHLLLVLLPQLKQPGFAFADSVWPEWATWVADGRDVPDQLPKDAHLRFLTELKRWTRGIEDVRMFLERPAHWADKRRQQARFTVFSKSYCPYSRRAKALLDAYGAHYDRYEVDLHRMYSATNADDASFFAQLLWDLTGHRTYPKILEGPRLLVRALHSSQGGSDKLEELHEEKLLHGILNGADVL